MSRFSQPDPYDGSYDATDPQSFNRYAYVQNDPVNFVDPTGLLELPFEPPPDEIIRTETWEPGLFNDFFLRYFLNGLFPRLRPNRPELPEREPQNPGGQFTPDQQSQVDALNKRVEELLKNLDCAKVLGGTKNAMALLEGAIVRSANTVNSNYRGAGSALAREARRLANLPNSANVAYSSVGGHNIYLNNRFFNIDTSPLPDLIPSGGVVRSDYSQETVFIHELRHNNRLRQERRGTTPRADYEKIEKACGTKPSYR